MTFDEWFKKEYPDSYYEPSTEYIDDDMRKCWNAAYQEGRDDEAMLTAERDAGEDL